MIPIKNKENSDRLSMWFLNKKAILFSFLVLGAFFAGFILFLALYRFGVIQRLYNLFF